MEVFHFHLAWKTWWSFISGNFAHNAIMESFYLGHRAQLPGADNRIIHDIVVLLTNKFNNLISKFGWFVTERYNWQGPLNKTTLFDFRFQWININVCIFICIRQPSHGARAARLHSRKGSYLSINNQLMWRSVDRAAVSRRYDSHGVMHSTQARHHMPPAISQQHKPWWPISTPHGTMAPLL